jgi:transcriptional regulator with XRE-family HTH domain
MKKTDELFILIKSLSTSEKRYFRRFSKLHSDSASGNYTKLFEAIDKMEDYNEHQIKLKFKQEKFAKQLGVTKLYLKNLIIRALRNYYEDKLPYLSNILAMADTHIMIGRWMFDTADKKIQKEKLQAHKEERFSHVLEWVEMEEYLLLQSVRIKELSDRNASMAELREETMTKYENLLDYYTGRNRLVWAHQNFGDALPEERKKEIDKLSSDPLIADDAAALSGLAKLQRIELLSRLYWITNKSEQGIELLSNTIQAIDKGEFGNELPLTKFFPLINRLISLKIEKRRLDEVVSLVDFADGLIKKHRHTISKLYEFRLRKIVLFHRIIISLYTGNFKDSLESVEVLKALVQDNTIVFEEEDQITFWMLEMMTLIEMEQFSKALQVSNQVINSCIEARKDLTMYAHWLGLICHIELKHYEIVKLLTKNAVLYASKNKLPIQLLTKVANDMQQMAASLEQKKPELVAPVAKALAQDIKDSKLYYICLEHWLERKAKV